MAKKITKKARIQMNRANVTKIEPVAKPATTITERIPTLSHDNACQILERNLIEQTGWGLTNQDVIGMKGGHALYSLTPEIADTLTRGDIQPITSEFVDTSTANWLLLKLVIAVHHQTGIIPVTHQFKTQLGLTVHGITYKLKGFVYTVIVADEELLLMAAA